VLHGHDAAEILIRSLTAADERLVIETLRMVLSGGVIAGVRFPIGVRARAVDIHVALRITDNRNQDEKISAIANSDSITSLGNADPWHHSLML
jgi:hypothetical protein